MTTALAQAEYHDCPAPGCRVRVPFDRFACARHWRMLPRRIKMAINNYWQHGNMEAYALAHEEGVAWLGANVR